MLTSFSQPRQGRLKLYQAKLRQFALAKFITTTIPGADVGSRIENRPDGAEI